MTITQRSLRKLNAPELIKDVYEEGKPFKEDIAVTMRTEPTGKAAGSF